MMVKYQPIIPFLLLCVWLAQSRFRILYSFEADDGICTGGCELRERSGASNGLATLMHEGDKLFIQFKIEANCSVSVENVRYSTDGPEQDTINITLANVYLGSFNTTSQKGDGQQWNIFKDSGHVGPTIPLPSEFYELILTVTVDNLGVEVDKITLNFNCDSDPGKLEVFQGSPTIATLSVHSQILIAGIIVPSICTFCFFITTLISVVINIYMCIKSRQGYEKLDSKSKPI